jgi:hypothetical protein
VILEQPQPGIAMVLVLVLVPLELRSELLKPTLLSFVALPRVDLPRC